MKRILWAALLILAFSATAHAQSNPCAPNTAPPAGHCTALAWQASPTSGVTYNVYRGTATGGESTTPLNSSPITTLAYVDPITLTSSQQTFYYTVKAVETSSGVTALSAPSNEVSVTFPGIPTAPASTTATAN